MRLVLLTLVAACGFMWLPSASAAWSNGPDGPNSFGTHDWVLQEANRLAAKKHAGWVKLKVALPHTDDPDSVFHDTYYHVYDVWGTKYGNAPKKVMAYYAKALKARKAGNWKLASKYVGIMSHYYADIWCPLHTDQCDAEDSMHSSYEEAAQEYTDAVGENRAWVTFDGYKPTKDVVAFTKTAAKASHRQYEALVDGYLAEGMSPAIVAITAKSMNRAANGLADLIVSIKRGVRGATASSRGGGGGGSGTTVYITKTGTKYHRSGCRYLAKSKIAISLSKAKAQGYTPCSVCKPPR